MAAVSSVQFFQLITTTWANGPYGFFVAAVASSCLGHTHVRLSVDQDGATKTTRATKKGMQGVGAASHGSGRWKLTRVARGRQKVPEKSSSGAAGLLGS